ncbi:MAG: response regulator, partial [Burkholderiaceae bacterium]|nr:response regulator [Burkholderiaceae bacterium]
TGIGLTDAQRDKLFQNFQQADESTSRKFGGTGLGLAISKQLVSLMGGEVGVDSEFGKGSTFWFTARLRRGTGPAVSAITRNADALIRRGARVLLVDDNEINREIASEILDGVGLSVQTATNGQEALDLLAAEAVDLVLMDIQMPVMDGLQATRAIRQQPALAHLPVIAMTANAFEEDRQICLDAGMNGYLTKPVSPDSLYKLLAEFIPHDGTQAPEPLPAPAAPVQSEPATPAAAAASDGFDADGSPINVDAGLEFCGGRMPSYRRLLGRFCELKTGATRELLDALKSGDRETAERVAHSMKGVASTLGAFALSRVAEELEFRIGEGEQGDALDQHILRFDQELSRALAHIRHLISTDAGAEESA